MVFQLPTITTSVLLATTCIAAFTNARPMGMGPASTSPQTQPTTGFRFHKMLDAPQNMHYPMTHQMAGSFGSDTNAVSLRVFSDDQVQDAISSIEHNNVRVRTLDELSAAIFDTHDNFKSTHADSTQQADRNQFWDEFREVIAVQLKREAGQQATNVFTPAASILGSLGTSMTMEDAAASVQSDFPTDFPTLLIKHLNDINGGTLDQKINSVIFKQCSYQGPEFVSGMVAVADMVGWAIREVSPAAFAVKWGKGRARPEEVAWEIYSTLNDVGGPTVGGFPVPADVANAINIMGMESAANFTAYKQGAGGSTTFGDGGSPVHPSYPAMHSAASSASTWLSVVFDLDNSEIDEARLLDFSVSYFRTMAGVHYRSDNKAGLALGQRIMKEKLPDFLAERYGCSDQTRSNIRAEVRRKIKAHVDTHDWATYLPADFQTQTFTNTN